MEAFRQAARDFFEVLFRMERKIDALLDEVRLRNDQYDTVTAKLDVLIAIADENRRREQERIDKERMSIIMPTSAEPM